MQGIAEFKDWGKIDLRVGEIIKVENIEKADKLYKLTIDIGDEKRTVCAGIKQNYSKEELQNKDKFLKIRLFASVASGGGISEFS